MTVTKLLGVAAVGAMLVMAAPTQQAKAMSVINPGLTAQIDHGAVAQTTEVRWHGRHGGWRRPWHPHRRHWR
jgi:hypothetical protein